MEKAVYKGITFANGYDKSFEDFKTDFASTHVFKNVPEEEREAELKTAYEIATKNTKKPAAVAKAATDTPSK